MKIIGKYTLEIRDEQILTLPIGSKILSAKEQFNTMVLYAIIDTEEEIKEFYFIRIYGTGHPFETPMYNYLDTVKLQDGRIMYHVFYRRDNERSL